MHANFFFVLLLQLPIQNLLSAVFVDVFLFPLASGIIQQQEQEHLGDDGATLAGLPGPASRSHTHKSRDKVNKGNSLCNVLLLTLFVVCHFLHCCFMLAGLPQALVATLFWCLLTKQNLCVCSTFYMLKH